MLDTVRNSSVSAERRSAAIRSLIRELDTAWMPDPWRFQDYLSSPDSRSTALMQDGIRWLQVPLLRGKSIRVPLFGPEALIRFQIEAARAVRHAQEAFAPGVVPYRVGPDGTFDHYRTSASHRRALETEFSVENDFLLVTDVRSFFRTVRPEHFERIAIKYKDFDYRPLASLLEELMRLLGYALPEGYAAARALGNIALLPLDETVMAPFTRWVDDYRIFVRSPEDANRILEALTKKCYEHGLSLAQNKTRIMHSAELQSHRAMDSIATYDAGRLTPEEVARELTDARDPHRHEQLMRLYLRLCGETGTFPSAALEEADNLPDSVLPRLVYSLASVPWSGHTSQLLEAAWSSSGAHQGWRRGRLSYLLWYAPAIEGKVLSERCFAACTEDELGPAFGRSLAKHRPELIPDLLTSSSVLSPRESRLLEAESMLRLGSSSAGVSDSDLAALGVPPPTSSYL